MATLDIPELEGQLKLREVEKLVKTLEDDLVAKGLSTTQKTHALLKLRHYGTKPQDADPIYSKRGIETLAKYGFDGETAEVRRAALRCIANACLLDPSMRQVFVDTGFGGKLAERLKCENSEDEMIIARILFLSTYDTNMDFDLLITKHALGENLNWQIARHAKQVPKNAKKPLPQQDEMAFIDILKLVFNISKIYPDLADTFTSSMPSLLKVIYRLEIPPKPLDGLLGYLINSLSTMDLTDKSKKLDINPLFPKFNQNCNSNKLINILDVATAVYPPEELDTRAVPLIQLLITMHEIAPDGAKKYMQWLLLPDNEDRSKPIGKNETLASKLLRLSTTPSMHLKTSISELMFVLSGKNAENLTRNIGYGFAAGFLASRGLDIPQNAGEAFATNVSDSEFNPITGQRWDAEPEDTRPAMTQEEKEREAERLFVLFERAKLNGLISVENPVATALREGRFEELPDDAESD